MGLSTRVLVLTKVVASRASHHMTTYTTIKKASLERNVSSAAVTVKNV
jgi:hypothetical protein